MFPLDFEPFDEIPNDAILTVEQDMQELNTKLDLLPIKMDESIIKNMYGKMEIKNDTMEIFNTSGELIRTFNLFDYVGNPTTTAGVFKREIKSTVIS